MGGRSKRKAPLPGDSGAGLAGEDAPVPGLTAPDVGAGPTEARGRQRVYLGVRVKRPVRDLLKKIRIDQDQQPLDLQKIYGNQVKDRQRVKMRAVRRSYTRRRSSKSLEELAIIVEVLEEDLRTGLTCSSPAPALPSPKPESPHWSSASSGYNSDESDDMSPGCGAPCWPRLAAPCGAAAEQADIWNRNNSAFFWAQLQREEEQLEGLTDAALLAADEHGKTALHQVACVGKRALGYAIAKRMAAVSGLDLKDADGMTPLLLAAKHNHHLMVADLILLGANVNEADGSGKTCLHLSAERGFTRVLEVLKNAMLDGVYVDVEATDDSGMSVLQCASVALKAAVRKLECSRFPNPSRLQALRQEQMLETLECLLQMGGYFHLTGNRTLPPGSA
ncbi:death-associated protein kinase 1 isoform X2 [Clinocottus analis]|uniref:death-associated protein kinase 1 isoform X2 n=1 Tax=Clinocottus analis TaxID=304258 RepID=UPI0035C219F3